MEMIIKVTAVNVGHIITNQLTRIVSSVKNMINMKKRKKQKK